MLANKSTERNLLATVALASWYLSTGRSIGDSLFYLRQHKNVRKAQLTAMEFSNIF